MTPWLRRPRPRPYFSPTRSRRGTAPSPQSAPGPRDRNAARTVQAGGRTYQIAVSAPLDAIHAELAAVRRAIFIALPLILALAGLGGYWLPTRRPRPAGRVAGTAAP